MPADLLLARLEKVKCSGRDKWMACCPAHDDKSPSLAIKEDPSGKVLVHCFAGCTAFDVVTAVGMGMSSLFPPSTDFDRREWQDRKRAEEAQRLALDDMLFIEMAKHDLANGIQISAADQQRVNTAITRNNNNDRN